MNATLNSILADLDSIGLDELNKRAAMLTRVDRKYALDAATASAMIGAPARSAAEEERSDAMPSVSMPRMVPSIPTASRISTAASRRA